MSRPINLNISYKTQSKRLEFTYDSTLQDVKERASEEFGIPALRCREILGQQLEETLEDNYIKPGTRFQIKETAQYQQLIAEKLNHNEALAKEENEAQARLYPELEKCNILIEAANSVLKGQAISVQGNDEKQSIALNQINNKKTSREKSVLLQEQITQQLIKLDELSLTGEARARRKELIKELEQISDKLDSLK